MSKLRSISTAFWSDPFIEDLSPSEKLIFLYLITNDKTNMLGIYEVSMKKISFETGVSKDLVEKALKGFEAIGKVKYIENYVILCNYLKHQHFNTNMKKSAIDVYYSLPESLKVHGFNPDRSNPLKAFETLSNHLGMVRKVEVEVEVEVESETKNEVEVKVESFDFKKSLYSLVINKSIVDEWLKVRKAKKAVNTETALNGFLNQVDKTSMTVEQVLTICVERSWSGFKPEWIDDNKPVKQSSDEKRNDEIERLLSTPRRIRG
jgi:hypothetical protein